MERNAKTERAAAIRILASVLLAGFSVIAWVPGAHAGPKGTDRPIEGACDNDITPLSLRVSSVLLAIDNTCHISHLGLTVGYTDSEVIVPAGPPAGTVLPVSVTVTKIVYVAANGDQLWSTFGGSGAIDFATGQAMFDGTETYRLRCIRDDCADHGYAVISDASQLRGPPFALGGPNAGNFIPAARRTGTRLPSPVRVLQVRRTTDRRFL